jgi:hypothetical protein
MQINTKEKINKSKSHTNAVNVTANVHRANFSPSMDSPASQTLHLQRTIGNQAVKELLKNSVLQAKLKISQPNDIYEQEADRVAEHVMRMPKPATHRQRDIKNEDEEQIETKPLATKITLPAQHPVEKVKKEKEKLIQFKSNPDQTPATTPIMASTINTLERGGQPLPESIRDYFEPRFGRDFSKVRVHTDDKSTLSAQSVNAKAYTVGNNIVFDTRLYTPHTDAGRRLVAHELVHVIQQEKCGEFIPSPSTKASPKESKNRKADATGKKNQIMQISSTSTRRLARAIIFEVGPELTQELIAMWETKIKMETVPTKITRYKRYIQNLKSGTPLDPKEAGWKAEQEWRYVHEKEIGVYGERSFKGGHRAGSKYGYPTKLKGTSKPDIGGRIEVKATDITSPKAKASTIRRISTQVYKRVEALPAHIRSQGVIIDIRASGTKVNRLQIEKFEKELLEKVKILRPENIQVVVDKGQIIKEVKPGAFTPKTVPTPEKGPALKTSEIGPQKTTKLFLSTRVSRFLNKHPRLSGLLRGGGRLAGRLSRILLGDTTFLLQILLIPIDVLIEIGKANKTHLQMLANKAIAYAYTSWVFRGREGIIWDIPEADLAALRATYGGEKRGPEEVERLRAKKTPESVIRTITSSAQWGKEKIDAARQAWKKTTNDTLLKIVEFYAQELHLYADEYRDLLKATYGEDEKKFAQRIYDELIESEPSASAFHEMHRTLKCNYPT